jgi:hypothetical protein
MTRNYTRAAYAAVGLVLALLTASPVEAQERRDRNRIGPDEIAQSNANNVHDLIQSRRANWLTRARPGNLQSGVSAADKHDAPAAGSSSPLLVLLDGAVMDDADVLKTIPLTGVRLVEYVNAGQTRFRFGRHSSVGAIAVYVATEPEAPSRQ